jgi:hypothetical protein
LQEVEGLLQVILSQIAPSFDVEGVSLSWFLEIGVCGVLKAFVYLVLLEGRPGQVLEDLEVVLVTNKCYLVLSDSLVVVILSLVQQTDFDQGVGLSPGGEGVGQDGVLEVADGLLDLVGLREDHGQLVENLTLLVEVRGHLQDSDEGTDGVVVGLELFVEDTDAVPELWVLDIVKTVHSPLVSVEGLLEVVHQKVAVTKSSPGWAVFWVNGDQLDVVLDGSLVLSLGGAELSQLVDSVDVDEVVAITSGEVLGNLLGLLESQLSIVVLVSLWGWVLLLWLILDLALGHDLLLDLLVVQLLLLLLWNLWLVHDIVLDLLLLLHRDLI